MADSRKETKIVEYKLQGNTVELETALQQAVSTIDALDAKLTKVATSARMVGGSDKTSFMRAAAISAAESGLAKTRKMLEVGAQGPAAISPDQLNLINQVASAMGDVLAKLERAKSETGITQKTLEKTTQEINKINKGIKAADVNLKGVKQTANQLKVLISNLSKALIIIRIILRYVTQLYTSAGDFVETINLFNVAIKNTESDLDGLAKKMADAYNTDIRPIYNAIATFRQYANTLKFTANAADTFSEGLTKLNYDLASLYNVDYSEMATALKSGLAGQTKALMRYGISVHKATVEQTALSHGITKSSKDWTAAETVALRYLTILEQTTSAQGDLARTLESPTNQYKVLKAQIQVLLRNLGSLVILLSQSLLPLLNGLLISFNKFLEVLAKAAGYEIQDYSDNLSPTNEMLDDMSDSAEDTENSLKQLLAPLDEINQASDKSVGIEAEGALDPSIENALRSYDNLMDQVQTKADILGKTFDKVFNNPLAQGIGKVLGGAFKILATAIDAVAIALNNLSPILNVVNTVLGAILKAAGWLISNVVAPVLSFIAALISQIKLLAAAFVLLNIAQLAVTGEFKSMLAVKIIQWFATLTAKIWANVAAHLANAAATLKSKLASVAIAITLWAETAAWWQKAIAIIAAAGALALVVAGVVAAATAAAANTAKSTTAQNLTPGKAAKGGVANVPTLTWIGEGRYSEAVVPLGNSPQFTSMKEDIADRVYGKMSQAPYAPYGQQSRGNSATVVLNINGRELARALLPDLGITRPQTGVKLV